MKRSSIFKWYMLWPMAVVLIWFACEPEKEAIPKPFLSVDKVLNITDSTATLVAYVVAQEGNITFSYRITGSTWKKNTKPVKTGTKPVMVTFDLKDLQPATYYEFLVEVSNSGGTESRESSFTTSAYRQAEIIFKPTYDFTFTFTSIKQALTIIPHQDSSIVSYEYQVRNSNDWTAVVLPTRYRGNDSIKLVLELNGLRAATDYDFKVTVSNRAGKSKAATIISTAAVSDYDGNFYRAVTIGSQTWLKENFRGTHFANGDPIPNVTDRDTWGKLTTGAYCYYNNDSNLGKIYGALYNWYVASDKRALISGWHVPIGDEQADIQRFYGDPWNTYPLIIDVKSGLWQGKSNASYYNTSGFSALPNGILSSLTSATEGFDFRDLGTQATFWAADWFGPGASAMTISANESWVVVERLYRPNAGMGIRLVRNK